MAMTEEKLAEIRKLRDYCQAVLDVEAILAEPEPKQPEPIDLVAWNKSQQNRVLACDPTSPKGEMYGTLSTEPAIKDVQDLAYRAKLIEPVDDAPIAIVYDMFQAAAEARVKALSLTVAPKEIESEPESIE